MTDAPIQSMREIAELSDVYFSYDRGKLHQNESASGTGLSDKLGRNSVLHGINLNLPSNSFIVVLGASGEGKSTLLRTLNGIVPNFTQGQFKGDIEVFGQDVTECRVSEMAKDVGMVFQDYETQLFGTSIEKEVAFGPENLAIPVSEISSRIEDSLSMVGLEDLDQERRPGNLSGGQKQRLVIGSVLANRPQLLVLDEPTSDLDPAGSRAVMSLIQDFLDEGRLSETISRVQFDTSVGGWSGPETVVVATHNLDYAVVADQVVLLHNGQIFRCGSPHEVLTDLEVLRKTPVEMPPVAKVFDCLGWSGEDLPLTQGEAIDVTDKYDLTWEPPAAEELVISPSNEDMRKKIFELKQVVHEYTTNRGKIRALDRVNLDIHDGEVIAIAGSNGSGKTTLAKHLNGLLKPDGGSIYWRGQEVADLPLSKVSRNVGYVFQNPRNQIFQDEVYKEVAFGPRNHGIEAEELQATVNQAIKTADLVGLEDEDPFQLSKGQQQRVALASVLATNPETIVFDEPTTGLDPTQQTEFMNLLSDLNREEGITIIFATHDMSIVTRYATRTVVMYEGRKVMDGPTREVFSEEEKLNEYVVIPPQIVSFSNSLADMNGVPEALPALNADEMVDCFSSTNFEDSSYQPDLHSNEQADKKDER